MINKITLLLFCFVFTTIGFSQTLRDADRLYENYEYTSAASIYAQYHSENELIEADKERLAYCYFVTGDHKKGIPVFQEVISVSQKPESVYQLAMLYKMAHQYENAVNTFEKYKAAGGDENVDLLIESCKAIPTWENIEYKELENNLYNDDKANILIPYQSGQDTYTLYETGLDSTGAIMEFASTNTQFAEVLFSRPFNISENIKIPIGWFGEEDKSLSVSTISINRRKGKIFFTVMQPLSSNSSEKAPHIYEGDYTGLYDKISNIKPWEHSGVNDSTFTAHPTLSQEGNYMIFSKITENGDADLFSSEFDGENWSIPMVLSSLNTKGDEMFPVIQGDTLLSFSSNGRVGYGDLDIYYTKMKNLTPDYKIEHYKSPINSEQDDFLPFWKNKYNLDFTSNRDEGKGDDDLWHVYFEKPLNADSIAFVEFMSNYESPRIYFGLDKSVSAQSMAFLDSLKQFMTITPNLEIDLVGHTDSRGRAKYNMALGLNRAQWVKKNMEEVGITPANISAKSVGETELVEDCPNRSKCTEQQHALNRFVEIKLVQK